MSRVAAEYRPPETQEELTRGRSPGWYGMWFLIFTEATLFAILLSSYFFIRFRSGPGWPPDGIEKPSLYLVAIMTPILLASSGPIHWGELGARQGKIGRLRLGLLLTSLLGAAFLILQGVEYHEILTHEFTARTNAYGTLFFTITGFHGAHVLIGLLMIGWLQVRAWRRAPPAESTIEVVTVYWHFVDVVWIFILASLYLSPHVWP